MSQTFGKLTRSRLWLLVSATLLLCSCNSLPTGRFGKLARLPLGANDSAIPSSAESPVAAEQKASQSRVPSREGPGMEQAAHRQILSPPVATAPGANADSHVVQASHNGPAAALKSNQAARGPRGGAARPNRHGGWRGGGLGGHRNVRLTAPPCPVCTPDMSHLGGSYCQGHERLKPLRLQDEYICDGGDHFPNVKVGQDGRIYGLELEDTVAHYRTEDGEIQVKASNRVCIYSPSFAAVRKVSAVLQHEQHQVGLPIRRRLGLGESSDNQVATTAIQPIQPIAQHGHRMLQAVEEKLLAITFENELKIDAASSNLLPFEDLKLVRAGILDNSEKARLAASMQNAVAWNGDQRVQVILDEKLAFEDTGDVRPQLMHRFDMPKGKPCLRVVKLASKQNALPGDEVEFTLRFDNVGDQTLDKITIVDNLTRRLEYVEGSAQCSVDAKFKATDNAQESLILSWTLDKPLEVNEGGIIRFKCRVR